MPGLSPRERETEGLGVSLHVEWGSLALGQLPDFLQESRPNFVPTCSKQATRHTGYPGWQFPSLTLTPANIAVERGLRKVIRGSHFPSFQGVQISEDFANILMVTQHVWRTQGSTFPWCCCQTRPAL